MMNVCEVSGEMGIGAEALPSCHTLQEALIEAQERFKKIGRYGLSGTGLKAAKDVFEYIEFSAPASPEVSLRRLSKRHTTA